MLSFSETMMKNSQIPKQADFMYAIILIQEDDTFSKFEIRYNNAYTHHTE